MSRSNAHFNVMFSYEVYVTNVADAASPVFKKKILGCIHFLSIELTPFQKFALGAVSQSVSLSVAKKLSNVAI